MSTFLSRAPVFIVGILAFTSMYFLFFMTKSPPGNAQYACGVSNSISKANKGQDKIGVGVEADYIEFPWQADIRIFTKSGTRHTCGGSLISDQWILTSAQCLKTNIEGDRVAEMWVTLGMHNYKTAVDVNRQSLELDMNSFFFHPDYSETLTADIALIKLPSVVTFSRFVHPVCLADWKEIDYVGEQVTIAGWGSTFKDQMEYFPNDAVLYKMRATVMSKSYCRDSFGEIEDSMLCTKGNGLGRSGACIISDYDRGSPLIFKRSNGKWRQIGILSLAKDCNKKPSILYTRVSFYAPWIKHTMAHSSGSHSFSFLSPTLISINFIMIYLKNLTSKV
ncbi:chymotrypsin-like elastase family member 2A [Daphnia pulicaria]|uniref:chymotrypsin-like elastase family member 2A n=1 Tax=Daphnia pulicaria TaxID=35523 RepID=UPI001EECCDCF|nr:chymotrypsin-like elastase family member 2A [Daphnia pulicaria]